MRAPPERSGKSVIEHFTEPKVVGINTGR